MLDDIRNALALHLEMAFGAGVRFNFPLSVQNKMAAPRAKWRRLIFVVSAYHLSNWFK